VVLNLGTFASKTDLNFFLGAKLNEEHDKVMNFHIPAKTNLTYSEMFHQLEEMKTKALIDDYYLGQSSLEEVFLSFTTNSSKSKFSQKKKM